jgi:V/A-type H+-transporting ATPase subunit F
MKILVVGNPEAVLGFSLAGIEGKPASSAAEAGRALDEALAAKDLGIVLVTRDAAQMLGPRMDQLRLRRDPPLVVEIPAPKGEAGELSLRDVVRRAIGVKI